MAAAITFCTENPIRTTLGDWMVNYKGRASVGIKREGFYEILAYSDQKSDFPLLSKMARKQNATFIKSVVSEGVLTID